jgi:hypothetical protein
MFHRSLKQFAAFSCKVELDSSWALANDSLVQKQNVKLGKFDEKNCMHVNF